jgi:hypothetical protein
MKRTFKLNGEVSPEANDMLVAYCKKHERSKGFLLEKMIRKFCVEVEAEPVAKTELAVVKEPKAPVKRFVPPMLESIYEYMKEREVNDIGEANKFNDFYQSNGWKVGRNKMKCWKAAVRNWLKGYKEKTGNKNILQDSSNSDWHLREDTGF